MRVTAASGSVLLILALLTGLLPGSLSPAGAQPGPAVTIVSPDDGEILDGAVTLRANVSEATATAVEFFYDAHEDDVPAISLGMASFDSSSGSWVLDWDTRPGPGNPTGVEDTYNVIDTDDDDVEDTKVNLTKPPTLDQLRVEAVTGAGALSDEVDVRIQNMLTVRFTLPDNQEDIRGFQDLEAVLTSEFEVTSVRFDLYDFPVDADPRLPTPFGEFQTLGEPIENPHYGRPLGNPGFPLGSPTHAIGAAVPEGTQRWVLRGWDTTLIPDGTWLLVATATDAGGRTATYMVESYIVNDLRVRITAPGDGDTVSRFVALEARTSSLTGADNAAPGSLWPATAVNFEIDGATDDVVAATEIPAGSGRWRAVWNGDTFAPGPYTITARAVNENPGGAEEATHSINVNLVAAGATLDAFFPFDWGNCALQVCSFLDGSGGGPTSWLWNFGDGNTSTDQLPTHTYDDPGVYTVSLTVSNDGGTTTDTYERVIPVGNVGVVSFNRNDIDDSGGAQIDWTSAFKDFEYEVPQVLAVPVMWKASNGPTAFASLPTTVCDDDEDSSNQECVIFTPEEATGTAPTLVGAAQDGVLFNIAFTEVQFRGITDIFKGKVNLRINVNVDSNDGNPDLDTEVQLGTNVDVTNSGTEGDELRVVKVIRPFEGQFVGGMVPVTAGVVSAVTADEVEFFVNGDSIGLDEDPNANGVWASTWDTVGGSYPDGPYEITAVARFGVDSDNPTEMTSAVRNANVENAIPAEPAPPAGTFQIGRTSDSTNEYITYPHEIEEAVEEGAPGGGGGGPPSQEPTVESSATAVILEDSITVHPGGTMDGGLIGGDALEFDIEITNTSALGSGAVLTAYAFQAKFSESPALASRIGDKAYFGQLVPGAHPDGPLTSVKKNGTANGLFTGRWKGICINSSTDFIPEFNAGLEDESLECGGNRADTDADGQPELQNPIVGLAPGQSQTVRIRVEAGTTDGALHVVEPGTLQGRVEGLPQTGPNGLEYFIPVINNAAFGPYPAIASPNVFATPDFADNKVLRDADGTFNPTFAPKEGPDGIFGTDDDYTLAGQQYLTFPRENFAFTDILGRNHTCETYGLHLITGIPCSGQVEGDGITAADQPVFGFEGSGDLLPGVPNFAAILHGYGEYRINPDGTPDLDADGNYQAPVYPYNTLCVNPNAPDGLRCGQQPFTPIAEFYKTNGDGSVTQQMIAGSYGALGSADQYAATLDWEDAEDVKEEIIPEPEPGGPCDPAPDPPSRKPSCAQLRTNATTHFHSLDVVTDDPLTPANEGGINGGDVAQFTMDITNTSPNLAAYLTAFNYQTKERNLADIGGLDGYTQDRRDIRVDPTQPLCSSLSDGACYNASLGIGQFPNVIGNGLLFGQMVWPDDTDREGTVIVPDLVHVDPVTGIDPPAFKLESVKKNGPFTPILKGNINFICVKSGLFEPDPDADAACAGDPAIKIDSDGELVPTNISQRLGLAPGETQSVRIRMEWGDFRGALLQIATGGFGLNLDNVRDDYAATQGLARFFDCSDQRELEFCHPDLVGENIGYLPNTNGTWLTPATLEEIDWVIINQPGDAAELMDFQENFGIILAMAGFRPSAEFYAPDPNPALVGTPEEGILIRQQVLGTYAMTDVPAAATTITSTAVTSGGVGAAYSYDVDATAFPGPIDYSLDTAPSGMMIDGSSGLIEWTPGASGVFDVAVRASNGTDPDAVQAFQVTVASSLVDDFNRADGGLGSGWTGAGLSGYRIQGDEVFVKRDPGQIYWAGGAFGTSQEVSIVMTGVHTGNSSQALLLKVQGGSNPRYLQGGIEANYRAHNNTVSIQTRQPGLGSAVIATFPATFVDGDRFTARALADGTVHVYRNLELIGSADTTPRHGTWFAERGGSIGLWYVDAWRATFDDFGGGSITP
jgi:PKD repeat protein